MKQKLRVFLTLLLCAVASVGWAEELFLDFSCTNGNTPAANGIYMSTSEGTFRKEIGDVKYIFKFIEGDHSSISHQKGQNGIQLGSSSKPLGDYVIAFQTSLNDISKVVIKAYANGGASLSVGIGDESGNITKQFSTEDGNSVNVNVSTSTSGTYTFTGDVTTGNIILSGSVPNKYFRIESITITYTTGGSTTETVATPTFSPAAGTYTEAQNVTLNCATDGSSIYYTTDGSEPSSASTLYENAINVTSTTTIKAIAVKDGMNNSNVATATYTIVQPLSTMDEIFAAATEAGNTATSVVITFNNWVISGVKNSNAYVTDGTKGFIIYQSNHGFVVGNVLNGTASCKVQLYNGSAEITNLSSATTGLTVTTGGTVTPITTMAIADLTGINTGSVFRFENLVYDGTNLSDGTNYIKPYTTLYSGTFENGKTYNVTGVYLQYNDTKEILPRSEDDIEEVTPTTPTVLVSSNLLAGLTYVAENGPSTAKTFSVSGENLTEAIALALDGNSNYEMSLTEGNNYANNLILSLEDGSVANTTVYVRLKAGLEIGEYTGTITLTSSGATNVTVNLSGSVTAPEAQNVTWDLSIDETATATVSEMTWTSNFASMGVYKGSATTNTNNYYPGTSGQNYTSTRFYKNSNLTITPVVGYKITSVVFTATTENYATVFKGSTWTNATAEASGTTVTITPTNGAEAIVATIGGTCGFTAVKVFYEDDSTPAISVEPTSIDATYEETDGTLIVTYANVDNSSADLFFCDINSETATYDWIVADLDKDKNIEYIIDANTGEARTAYLKVKVGDVYSNLVSITQAKFVADYTTLPFSYDGTGATVLANEVNGLSGDGIGSYTSSSPKIKFDKANQYLILKFNERPGTLIFDIKGNSFSDGTFTVQTSANGTEYTTLATYTELTSDVLSESFTNLAENVRYIKWIYTTKVNGNVALGNIYLNSYVEPVSTTISLKAKGNDNNYYGTLYYGGMNLVVPANMMACTYKVANGTLNESKTYDAGDVIPASTAVVLKTETAGAFSFAVTNKVGEGDVGNMLHGSVDESGKTYAGEGSWKYYKLTTKNDTNLGFYFGVDGGAPFANGANKAYLAVPADQALARGYVFGDESTSIGQIGIEQMANNNAAIYNLSGQRVQKATKGVYIVNGKKVVIK